jgi:hypothetical protein
MAMTNGILTTEVTLSSTGSLFSNSIGKTSKAAAEAARMIRLDKATGKGARGRIVQQSLPGGFLDPKSWSLSLTALARAAAFSGKRLVIEIRDENPVRIIRTSTKGT